MEPGSTRDPDDARPILGRVLDPQALLADRGPDGGLDVTVPAAWLGARRWIRLTVPRTLVCAACDGGGCDACGRSGAVETRPRGSEPAPFEVELPPSPAVVRLPGRGGLAEGLPSGHLLLRVRAGATASKGVELVTEALDAAPEAQEPALGAATLGPGELRAMAAGAAFALGVFALAVGILSLR